FRHLAGGSQGPLRGVHTGGRRFVVPIAYLKSNIFQELLRMSEEEFGVPVGDRPITLPCDAAFMEHVVASLRDARWKKPCAAPFLLTRA
ncbi:unnamed protein product, partial [Musa textilis]